MLKQLRNEINKTNGTSFDEGYISQLLDKKIITNVKTSQHLDSFRLSTTEITSKNNLTFRGGSRTDAASKVELFVILVNGWKPLTIITKSSTLDVAAALDPPLPLQLEEIVLDDTEQCQHSLH